MGSSSADVPASRRLAPEALGSIPSRGTTTFSQKSGQVLWRHRLAAEIPLNHMASLFGYEGRLLVGFHTLPDHGEFQAPGHRDNGCDERRSVGIRRDVSNKGLIDLERVQR